MSRVPYSFFGLLIVFGVSTCNGFRTRIINGTNAHAGKFPYQVSLQLNNQYLHCGGIILDKIHVLTAAHCMKEAGFTARPQDLSVVVGSVDLERDSGMRYQVSDVKLHESYSYGDGWPNDIALLRLQSEIQFGKNIIPAILPEPGDTWVPGQPALVSGYGMLEPNTAMSKKLQQAEVFIISNGECQQRNPADHIRATNICTRHPNKIAGFCKGDSGGPLTVNGKVVGIVSFSPNYGCAGNSLSPQVYTRISAYIDWINYWRNSYITN